MVQNALCLGTVKLTKGIIINYLIIFPLKSLHQKIIKTCITIINHLPNSGVYYLWQHRFHLWTLNKDNISDHLFFSFFLFKNRKLIDPYNSQPANPPFYSPLYNGKINPN